MEEKIIKYLKWFLHFNFIKKKIILNLHYKNIKYFIFV